MSNLVLSDNFFQDLVDFRREFDRIFNRILFGRPLRENIQDLVDFRREFDRIFNRILFGKPNMQDELTARAALGDDSAVLPSWKSTPTGR
jgi:hypothetical protein